MACAPTGSGKTVLFELAIIRLLLETSEPWKDVKAVYSKQNNNNNNNDHDDDDAYRVPV